MKSFFSKKLKQIQRLGSPKAGPYIYEGRVEWGQSWLRLRAKWLGSEAPSSSSQGPQPEDKYSKTPCIHAMRFEMLKNSDWPRSCCAPLGGPAKGLPIILAKKASKPERGYFKELWLFCHADWCRFLNLLACLICISTSRVQHEVDALVENKTGRDRGTFVVMSASAVSRHYGSTAVPPHGEWKIKLEHLHIKQNKNPAAKQFFDWEVQGLTTTAGRADLEGLFYTNEYPYIMSVNPHKIIHSIIFQMCNREIYIICLNSPSQQG